MAAQLSGLHPQTLRQYDRLGLVSPDRTAGRGRRYSARDIELLRTVQQLSQDEGINLAGIRRSWPCRTRSTTCAPVEELTQLLQRRTNTLLSFVRSIVDPIGGD